MSLNTSLSTPAPHQRNFTCELFFSDDKKVVPASNLLYNSALNAIWSNDSPPNLLRSVSRNLWEEAATCRDWNNIKRIHMKYFKIDVNLSLQYLANHRTVYMFYFEVDKFVSITFQETTFLNLCYFFMFISLFVLK